MVKIFTGKDVDEATGAALLEIGVKLEDLDIKVINPGRSGILGFGGEHAEIEVSLSSGEPFADEIISKSKSPKKTNRNRKTRKNISSVEENKISEDKSYNKFKTNNKYVKDEEAEKLIGELLDYFLGAMGVVAETYIREEESESLIFEIDGEDSGLLIGRRGETLRSLQFLVRMISKRQLERQTNVYIDVQGYRDRRYRFIKSLAHKTAKRVIDLNEPIELDPMPPNERKIIHQSLSRNSRIATESRGKGNTRRITIFPAG